MKLLFTTRTTGALLTLSLLCAAVWGLGSCSRESAAPPATSEVSAPAPVKKKVSADGIEIIEHPALPETKDLRPLAVAPEPAANPAAAAAAMPAQPLTVSGEGGLTLSKAPGEKGSLLTVEAAADQKLQRQPQPAEGPQTAPMRLEARHQAMAEMLRVRKAAETASPNPNATPAPAR